MKTLIFTNWAATPRALRALFCGAAVAVGCVAPALADDTEIFFNQAGGLRPNILFIIDTSGSMNSLVTLPRSPYDASRTYDGSCSTGRLYWISTAAAQGGALPVCDGADDTSIAATDNRCNASSGAMSGTAGFWTGRAAQFDQGDQLWQALRSGFTGPVECETDAGVHGADATNTARYARNGNAYPWTSNAGSAFNWDATEAYSFYSANYLNWYYAPPEPSERTRLETVQAVATSLAASIDNVNLGLMRFSNTSGPDGDDFAEGGMVTHEIAEIAGARSALIERINSYTANGFTPLSETMYEAQQYFAGRAVQYGLNSTVEGTGAVPSVATSRVAGNQALYQSPIEFQCQRNFAILLTDGEPTSDRTADSRIESLPNFDSLVGGSCSGSGDGRCLDEIAEYMFDADLSPLPGQQNVTTYTIGLGPDVAGSTFLAETAARGGGRSFSATDNVSLTAALQSIVGEIAQTASTFTAPAVSINAFNRTQTTNELYVSLFQPEASLRWLGNLKKYALRNGAIVDADGNPAVDPATGFIAADTRSIWSAQVDEGNVQLGGAVSRLPDPDARNIYTYVAAAGNRALTAAANTFNETNAALTDAVLRTNTPGAPTRSQLLRWARGYDVQDADADGDTTEVLRTMGDPLHARPALVTYGGNQATPDALDSIVFVPTNDGFIHAVDARTGVELWAFIPPQLLGRLVDLYRNPAVALRSYGLDADVRVLRFDTNLDGVIDSAAGDRVWIFFGMRRGGRHYYALDVTDRNSPRLRWSIGPNELPGIGETWSTPSIARVRIAGATQNGENLVLIFGGGYDGAQENVAYTNDEIGNSIYMVDAERGTLLWSAGGPPNNAAADLALPRMTHSIPGRVVVLDNDGDQYADRLYAGDLGGRIWRFDIWNGRSRAELVTGGVLATLGSGDTGQTTNADNRRFYSAPDVALIQRRGAEPYYNLAIGSGYRGHPLNTETGDRFYSIRDRNPFGRLTQAAYDNLTAITDGALVDITDNIGSATVPATSAGWKLEMRLNGAGEKVLAEAITVDGTILFTSYEPQTAGNANPCLPANGINRFYALRVDNASPALDLNDDEAITPADALTRLVQTGIAGEVTLALESVTGPPNPNEPGTDPLGRRGVCVVGVEVLQRCVVPGSVVRTYWQRTANNSAE